MIFDFANIDIFLQDGVDSFLQRSISQPFGNHEYKLTSTLFYRSLRKVMLRTCIDTTDTSTKDFPATPYTAEKRFLQDNGDIFGKNTEDYQGAFNVRFPGDIPGFPKKKLDEYSPRCLK